MSYGLFTLENLADGLLDSDTSYLALSVDDDEEVLLVATPSGAALWKTGPADFDVVVGAEICVVREVVGDESPQEFVVTRIDGNVKAWPRGTKVSLYRRSVLS